MKQTPDPMTPHEDQPYAVIPEFYRGNPVDADDLRYRDVFINELWESIQRNHVLLTAPRRTGKTSVMDHLQKYPQFDFTVIKENVQDLSHPADFFVALLARFHDEHPKLLHNTLAKGWELLTKTFSQIDTVAYSEFKVALRASDEQWKENWRFTGEKLLEQLRKHGSNILIIIDEFPDMLLNMNRENPTLLREFLAWFSTQRQQPNPQHDPIRWLIGGSVNLSSTLDALGHIDLINDLDDISLPLLTNEQVEDYIVTMLKGRGVIISKDLTKQCLTSMGRPIPLFMQMLTQDLYRMWKKRADDTLELNSNDVKKAVHALIRSSAAQDKLQHFYTRIARYYSGVLLTAAYAMLSQLSLKEGGLMRSTLQNEFYRHLEEAGQSLLPHERKQAFNQLMRNLANDFYIEEIEGNQYDFSSGILKSWWRKYYA
jgi:hypothetical protein